MRYIYFGKRLRAGVELPPIICFFIYTAGADKTISVIAALFLHELGHIAAALIRGRLPESVTLSAAGADISYKGLSTYDDDIFVCSAGPAVNLIFALLFFRIFPIFSFSGAFYGILNLMPAPCFDGGRILSSVLFRRYGHRAEKAVNAAGIAALLMLYLLSVSVLFCTGSNVSLLILCASVFFGTYVKRGKFNNMI